MTSAIHRTRSTPVPQSQPLDRRQVKNSAGGYAYQIPLDQAFERFLILGTAGGTYYASERKLTQDGMQATEDAVNQMSPRDYADLVIRAGNTAPKRTYALYAIAAALIHGSDELKALAPQMAREVCKTGTDVFELASYIRGERGWGPSVKRVFNEFLVEMDVEKLGLWTVKYRSRFGWTWDDLLRMQHPNVNGERDALFRWVTGNAGDALTHIKVVDGFRRVQGVTDEKEVIEIVTSYGLPWEALSDEQRTPAVWKASLPNIGVWAILRNLATFTRLGLSDDKETALYVEARLLGQGNRVHPVSLLEALRTYGAGGAVGRSKGGAFRPLPMWLGAVDKALEVSFTDGVERLGQDIYVGLDVSGSMGSPVSGSFVLSCRDVGAALALGFAKNEPFTEINGFTAGATGRWTSTGLTHFGWNQQTSFASAVAETQRLAFGATDCALPMLDAAQRNLGIDTFIVITDNETWAGSVHPMQALRDYRKVSGRQAKLAVIALTSTGFSIADPADPLTMDFVGFSSDLPKALASFMKMG